IIRTEAGTLDLVPATVDELRAIARYWPMEIRSNDFAFWALRSLRFLLISFRRLLRSPSTSRWAGYLSRMRDARDSRTAFTELRRRAWPKAETQPRGFFAGCCSASQSVHSRGSRNVFIIVSRSSWVNVPQE